MRNSTGLIICAALVQVEYALFLPKLLQIALSFVQLGDEVALGALQLLDHLLESLNLLASQLLHLFLGNLVLDLRMDGLNFARPLQLLD
mmetsp:Transcript_7380/g.8558  ORF Transcript_7380/g.8558 Transcript_7380/m.8558 type:complete len:89 (+) Transcript_7380:754-1020(+)